MSANVLKTIKHVHDARRAVPRRCFGESPAVIDRNEGTAANGSTRKKIELRATIENCSAESKLVGIAFESIA